MGDIDQIIACFRDIAKDDELVEANDAFAIHALRFRQQQAAVGLEIAERLKAKVDGESLTLGVDRVALSAEKMPKPVFHDHLVNHHGVDRVAYDALVPIEEIDYGSQLGWHADDHAERDVGHIHSDSGRLR